MVNHGKFIGWNFELTFILLKVTSIGNGNNRGRGSRPTSMGVVRLGPVRLQQNTPRLVPPGPLIPSCGPLPYYRPGQMVPPPPMWPPPAMQTGNRPQLGYYPQTTGFIGTPVASVPPPSQMGVAGYNGMDTLQKYQQSNVRNLEGKILT